MTIDEVAAALAGVSPEDLTAALAAGIRTKKKDASVAILARLRSRAAEIQAADISAIEDARRQYVEPVQAAANDRLNRHASILHGVETVIDTLLAGQDAEAPDEAALLAQLEA